MTTQFRIPIVVPPDEIARKKSLGAALEYCAELGGFVLDKQLAEDCRFDKGQFSRWLSGTEGIVWPKFELYMKRCGNHAPVLWMLYQCGFDLHSLRVRETETERALRAERELRIKAEERAAWAEDMLQRQGRAR